MATNLPGHTATRSQWP